MKICLYALCFNEMRLAPYFLNHYEKICDKIVVYDNMSTDGCDEFLAKHPKVEIRKFDTGGNFDDKEHVNIKNNCWKECINKYDWVIVIDFDEFLYHPDLNGMLEKFKQDGITYPKMMGFQMISNKFPEDTTKQIYDQVTDGFYDNMFSKRIIFDPNKIKDMNYTIGAHNASPKGFVKQSDEKLYMLHFKHIDNEYEMSKINGYNPRISKNPGATGWYRMHTRNLSKPDRFKTKKIRENLIGKINDGSIIDVFFGKSPNPIFLPNKTKGGVNVPRRFPTIKRVF